jgi:hypothetical protein
MRPNPRTLLFAAVLAFLPMGCGTMANLTAPPAGTTTYRGLGPTTCEPFGGVTRSFVTGGLCLASGLTAGFDDIGQGGLLRGTGLVAAGSVILAVETPLSLVGDVATLPIAYARRDGMAWATWWGDQGETLLPHTGDDPGRAPGSQAPQDAAQNPAPPTNPAQP